MGVRPIRAWLNPLRRPRPAYHRLCPAARQPDRYVTTGAAPRVPRPPPHRDGRAVSRRPPFFRGHTGRDNPSTAVARPFATVASRTP